tara:strand:+ start:676 stop:1383 length:708 start_codon:yes stop_codon:yes gene_type:complete
MKINKISVIIILSVFILFILICQKNDVGQNNNQSLNHKDIIKRLEQFNSIEGEDDGEQRGQQGQVSTNSNFIPVNSNFSPPSIFIKTQYGGIITVYWEMPPTPDNYYPSDFKVELIKEGVGQPVQDYLMPNPKCSNCSLILDNLEAGPNYSIKIAIIYSHELTNEIVSTPFSERLLLTVKSEDSISNRQYRDIISRTIKTNERQATQLKYELAQNKRISRIKRSLDRITQHIQNV